MIYWWIDIDILNDVNIVFDCWVKVMKNCIYKIFLILILIWGFVYFFNLICIFIYFYLIKLNGKKLVKYFYGG